MNFNNNQIKIIENLIDDRIFFLRENIGYCQNYLPDCRTDHELEENKKAISTSTKELNSLIEFKSLILSNQELKQCI
tara:strand:- start:21 stop:251 length:231 start_codon:yes stop_codon:yes gene_type:complete